MEDVLLQDGSEVFRVGGGKSVQIAQNNSSHNDAHSVLLILRNVKGTVLWCDAQ